MIVNDGIFFVYIGSWLVDVYREKVDYLRKLGKLLEKCFNDRLRKFINVCYFG